MCSKSFEVLEELKRKNIETSERIEKIYEICKEDNKKYSQNPEIRSIKNILLEDIWRGLEISKDNIKFNFPMHNMEVIFRKDAFNDLLTNIVELLVYLSDVENPDIELEVKPEINKNSEIEICFILVSNDDIFEKLGTDKAYNNLFRAKYFSNILNPENDHVFVLEKRNEKCIKIYLKIPALTPISHQ